MSKSIIATTVALAGTVLAQQAGQAVVKNSCGHTVYMLNVPASGGGFSQIAKTLNPGDSYSQTWTELTNAQGWSIKLSKDAGSFGENIMQYEYTWHGWEGTYGGLIWYDLSDVNGNPWEGNWAITATGDCVPRQAAYQYPTDDDYGEQSCPGESAVTVDLCGLNPSSGGNGGSSSSAESSSVWTTTASSSTESTPVASTPTTTAPSSTESSPVASTPTTTATRGFNHFPNFGSGDEKVANGKGKKNKGTPTTLATVATANRGGVTVTNIATAVVTEFVTATPEAGPVAVGVDARHEHLARHQHHHRH